MLVCVCVCAPYRKACPYLHLLPAAFCGEGTGRGCQCSLLPRGVSTPRGPPQLLGRSLVWQSARLVCSPGRPVPLTHPPHPLPSGLVQEGETSFVQVDETFLSALGRPELAASPGIQASSTGAGLRLRPWSGHAGRGRSERAPLPHPWGLGLSAGSDAGTTQPPDSAGASPLPCDSAGSWELSGVRRESGSARSPPSCSRAVSQRTTPPFFPPRLLAPRLTRTWPSHPAPHRSQRDEARKHQLLCVKSGEGAPSAERRRAAPQLESQSPQKGVWAPGQAREGTSSSPRRHAGLLDPLVPAGAPLLGQDC